MKSFAIIRHAKVKSGRHLVSTGLHNARSIPTPNADPDAGGVEVIVGSKKPWRDVDSALRAMKIDKVRKNGNVAVEVMMAASPEWWASRGWVAGEKPSLETRDVIDAWVDASVAHLRRLYSHRLVSVVLHLDEATPHIHSLVIPAVFRKDGREKTRELRWRLSAETMLRGPSHMKQLVTDYAGAMAKFGLTRGENHETATTHHKSNKQWQAEQASQFKALEELVMEQQKIKIEGDAAAGRIVAAARAEAARITAEAEKKMRETEEYALLVEVERRRQDADTSARDRQLKEDRVALDAERQAVAAERAEVTTLRQHLVGLIAVFERLLAPIQKQAREWMEASGLMKQAIGSKGPRAKDIMDSAEVVEVRSFLATAKKAAGR